MTRPGQARRTGGPPAPAAVDRAVAAFRRGEPVLVYDAPDREGETDLVCPAGAVDAGTVCRLRNHAGGLVCVALTHDICERLDLPFAAAEIDHPLARDHSLAYDDRSSFSLTVNHRDTETGITDHDRAKTIRTLADVESVASPAAFARNFRSPGHVHLLRAAPALVADRRGHTEFALELAAAADRAPAAVVCEMLDDETGRARSPADARAYARQHDLVFVDGKSLLDGLPSAGDVA